MNRENRVAGSEYPAWPRLASPHRAAPAAPAGSTGRQHAPQTSLFAQATAMRGRAARRGVVGERSCSDPLRPHPATPRHAPSASSYIPLLLASKATRRALPTPPCALPPLLTAPPERRSRVSGTALISIPVYLSHPRFYFLQKVREEKKLEVSLCLKQDPERAQLRASTSRLLLPWPWTQYS